MRICGHTLETVGFASNRVLIPKGDVEIRLLFSGGTHPEITELRCAAESLTIEFVERRVTVNGEEAAIETPLVAVEELLDHLYDLSVHVEAIAGSELWIKIAPGLQATIPAAASVAVDAATRGPPNRPRLVRSLVLSVGGTGLSIRLPGSRWLKALASIAIRSASLAPDGAVELTGHGPSALDRVVGAGLRHTSSHLSELVRRAPQFARVRSFLGTDDD